MKNKFKIISLFLSMLFMIAAGYIYYLFNNIPDYYYTQLTTTGIKGLMYGLISIGSFGILYNLVTIGYGTKSGKNVAYAQVKNHIVNLIKRNSKSNLESEFQLVLNGEDANDKKVNKLLTILCEYMNACHGTVYSLQENSTSLTVLSKSQATKESINYFNNYEYKISSDIIEIYNLEKKYSPEEIIKQNHTPLKNYRVLVLPLKNNTKIKGILELAFTREMDEKSTLLLNQLSQKIAQLLY